MDLARHGRVNGDVERASVRVGVVLRTLERSLHRIQGAIARVRVRVRRRLFGEEISPCRPWSCAAAHTRQPAASYIVGTSPRTESWAVTILRQDPDELLQ